MTNPNPSQSFPTGNRLGGARPGSGPKKSEAKRLLEQLMEECRYAHEGDAGKERVDAATKCFHRLMKLVDSKDEKVALQAVVYVMDRRWGKPRQTLEVQQRGSDTLDVLDAAELAEIQRITQEAT